MADRTMVLWQPSVLAHDNGDGTYSIGVYDPAVIADLALLLTRIGNPDAHILASLTAKWGNIARSLDLILGARWDGAGDLGTDIAAILADTNELQVDWVNGGRLDLLLDACAKTTELISGPAVDFGATAKASLQTSTAAALAAYKTYQVIYSGTLTTSSVSAPADNTAATGCGTIFPQSGSLDNYWIRITGGTGAAAKGQMRPIRTYVVTGVNGVFNLDRDLTALPGLVTYEIWGPPSQADRLNQIQGGTVSLQTLQDNDAAELDLAEVRTIASPVTLTANYQYIYSEAPGVPFFFAGGFLTQVSGAWAGGESVDIDVEVKIDGTNWVQAWLRTLAAAASPLAVAVPADSTSLVATTLLNIPKGFYNAGGGVRVGIRQTVEGAGFGVWNHSFLDAVRGT